MSVRRKSLLFTSLLFAMTGAAGDDRVTSSLEDSAHDAWQGTLGSAKLPDGSVFSEYEASTFSGNKPGASLVIAFSPRFGCDPMISFNLPSTLMDHEEPETRLILAIDGAEVTIEALLDGDLEHNRFAYNAVVAEQQALRLQLDAASWITLQIPMTESEDQDNDVSAESTSNGSTPAGNQPVHFSLLGSTMTTKAVQNHCMNHQPIPLQE